MNRELLPLCHDPVVPVRPDVIGEVVFHEAWIRLMNTSPAIFGDAKTRLEDVLSYYGEKPMQREATVCASLIVWLGTSCGLGFLAECKRALAKFISHEDAYIATWAIQNARRSSINRGIRTLEHCLGTEFGTGMFGRTRYCHPDRMPTADDYECAESLIRWLSTNDGQRFIAYCEAEIERRRKPIVFPFCEEAT